MRLTPALLCLLVPTVLAAQGPVVRNQGLDADAAVKIHNMTGPVTIHGWSRDSIMVRAVEGDGRFFMGGGRKGVKLGLDMPPGTAASREGTVEVWLPAGARLWVITAEGRVEVAGMTGMVDVASTAGPVAVRGVLRELKVETMDGDIALDAQSPWMRAKTASGSIRISGAGEDVAAESVSGSIVVDGKNVRRARFETVTGDVAWRGSLLRDGSLELETHAGGVELRLPAGLAAEVDANSYRGVIRDSWAGRKPVASADGLGQELHMTQGDGSARISVRTFKGTITLLPASP